MLKAGVGQGNQGSALIYILVAIALLAGLTATFMGSSNQNQSAERTFDLVTKLGAQIQTIRSAVQECVLTYPDGDKTMPAAPATVGGVAVVRPYPLSPSNNYLASHAANSFAHFVRCPGNPGNSNNHEPIFNNSGKYFPRLIEGFNNWRYYNGVDGVYISIANNKTDAYIATALQKLDDQFAECEADIVDAMTPNANVNMTSDGSVFCAAGFKCFRVWLVANPSNVYLGDTDGDEVGCP